MGKKRKKIKEGEHLAPVKQGNVLISYHWQITTTNTAGYGNSAFNTSGTEQLYPLPELKNITGLAHSGLLKLCKKKKKPKHPNNFKSTITW